MAEFGIFGDVPFEWGPDVWMNRADAEWMRRDLHQAGIQCRLLPSPITSLFIVQAMPDMPRSARELFCPPELDDG